MGLVVGLGWFVGSGLVIERERRCVAGLVVVIEYYGTARRLVRRGVGAKKLHRLTLRRLGGANGNDTQSGLQLDR